MAEIQGPKIVRDGLVLALDAADKNSYPGTGTSMYDLSGNGRNGTLTNGPTFNSANSGFIVFDYTNDFIGSFVNSNLGTPSTFTLSAWVRSSNISLDQNIFNANPPFFLRITSSTDCQDLARRCSGITTGIRVWRPLTMRLITSSTSQGLKSVSRDDGSDPPGRVRPWINRPLSVRYSGRGFSRTERRILIRLKSSLSAISTPSIGCVI